MYHFLLITLIANLVLPGTFRYIDHGEKLLFECEKEKLSIKAVEKKDALYDLQNKKLPAEIQKEYLAWKKSNDGLKEEMRHTGQQFQFKCR